MVLPAIGVSQGVLNFRDQPVGTKSAPQGLTITNDGTTSTAVDVNVVPSAFVAASDLCDGRTLAPGESCVLTITFQPRQPIFHESVVTIHSQSDGVEAAPEVVTLAGGGTPGPGGTSRRIEPGEMPAISDDGRYVVSRSPATQEGQRPGLAVQDQLTGSVTERFTPASSGVISGPSLSGNGRLAAFDGGTEDAGGNLDFSHPVQTVVDLHTRNGPGNAPATHQVTGVSTDLPLQRGVDCAYVVEVARCGPDLSGDGTALAYTAWLQPESDALALSVAIPGAEPWTDYGRPPLVDFHPVGELPDRKQVIVEARKRITFSAAPTIGGRDPDAFQVAATTCNGTLAAEASCTIDLEFSADEACGTTSLATLATHSALTSGQVRVPLIGSAPCESPTIPDDSLLPGLTRALAACAPMPAVQQGYLFDDSRTSTGGQPVAARLDTQVGRVGHASQVVTNNGDNRATLSMDADGCSAGLVVPEEPAEDAPAPCELTSVLAPGAQCTAYMAFRPDAVGMYAATLDLTPAGGAPESYRFYAQVGQEVVLLRQDPSGSGDFSGPGRPAPEIINVDDAGQVMDVVDGGEPSVSGDGRFVAFTILVDPDGDGVRDRRVYLRDRQAETTELVSLLTDGDEPPSGVEARSPSLSRDGRRLAFETTRFAVDAPADSAQVYVRDLETDETVIASARAVNPDLGTAGDAGSPDLSDDGTTVAYVSSAADLVSDPTNGEAQVYARYVDADFAGAPATERYNELVTVTPTGVPPPEGGTRSAGAVAIDEDGSFVAFATAAPLIPDDTDEAEDIYVRRRFPLVSMQPVALDFGLIEEDTTSQPQRVLVRNDGPGPVRLPGFGTEPPFAVGEESAQACTTTLHRGESCAVDVTFAPLSASRYDDLLLMRTAQGYLAGPTDAVTLTGAVALPGAAAISVVPGALSFGPHTLHRAGDPLTVTVRNVGEEPLQVAASVSSPVKDFAVRGAPCRELLQPGQECRVPVEFAPRRLGERRGRLLLRADAADGEVTDPVSVPVQLSGSTIRPTLEASPGLVRPGRVTQVIGRNFPPDVDILLRWSAGIGTTQADPNFNGRFETPMLVFKRDILGPRELLASIPGVGTIRSEPIFVVPLTGQPPDFVTRG